jgi:hypothetical protein
MMQEDVAKIVYAAMCWAAKVGPQLGTHTPVWVQGRNSHAQEEARSAACKISDLYIAPREPEQ